MSRVPVTLQEVENGYIVSLGTRAFVYLTWEEAAKAVAEHFDRDSRALGAIPN